MDKKYVIGNTKLWKKEKTVFLSSRATPECLKANIFKWTKELSPDKDCILCGNHSPMEQEVFQVLLQLKIPTIWVTASSLPKQFSPLESKALQEERLLIIDYSAHNHSSTQKQKAFERNEQMLKWANHIVVGYYTPGGNIAQQISDRSDVRILATDTSHIISQNSVCHLTTEKSKFTFEMLNTPTNTNLKITRYPKFSDRPHRPETLTIDSTEIQSIYEAIGRMTKPCNKPSFQKQNRPRFTQYWKNWINKLTHT